MALRAAFWAFVAFTSLATAGVVPPSYHVSSAKSATYPIVSTSATYNTTKPVEYGTVSSAGYYTSATTSRTTLSTAVYYTSAPGYQTSPAGYYTSVSTPVASYPASSVGYGSSKSAVYQVSSQPAYYTSVTVSSPVGSYPASSVGYQTSKPAVYQESSKPVYQVPSSAGYYSSVTTSTSTAGYSTPPASYFASVSPGYALPTTATSNLQRRAAEEEAQLPPCEWYKNDKTKPPCSSHIVNPPPPKMDEASLRQHFDLVMATNEELVQAEAEHMGVYVPSRRSEDSHAKAAAALGKLIDSTMPTEEQLTQAQDELERTDGIYVPSRRSEDFRVRPASRRKQRAACIDRCRYAAKEPRDSCTDDKYLGRCMSFCRSHLAWFAPECGAAASDFAPTAPLPTHSFVPVREGPIPRPRPTHPPEEVKEKSQPMEKDLTEPTEPHVLTRRREDRFVPRYPQCQKACDAIEPMCNAQIKYHEHCMKVCLAHERPWVPTDCETLARRDESTADRVDPIFPGDKPTSTANPAPKPFVTTLPSWAEGIAGLIPKGHEDFESVMKDCRYQCVLDLEHDDFDKVTAAKFCEYKCHKKQMQFACTDGSCSTVSPNATATTTTPSIVRRDEEVNVPITTLEALRRDEEVNVPITTLEALRRDEEVNVPITTLAAKLRLDEEVNVPITTLAAKIRLDEAKRGITCRDLELPEDCWEHLEMYLTQKWDHELNGTTVDDCTGRGVMCPSPSNLDRRNEETTEVADDVVLMDPDHGWGPSEEFSD